MNNKRLLSRRSMRPLDACGIFLLTQLSIYVLQSLVVLIFGIIVKHTGVVENETTKMILNDFVMFINMAAFVLTPLVYCRYTGIDFLGELNIKKGLSLVQVLLLIVISWCAIASFMPVASLFIEGITKLGYKQELALPMYFENFGMLVLSIIFTALLPAIGEEVMCRGFLARGLRKYGMLVAVFVSSLLFATMHGNLLQLVYQFFLGIILVLVYFVTRSIYASMIVHFVNNTTSLVITYIIYQTTGQTEFSIPLEGAALVFAMLGIGLAGFVLLCLVMWAFLRVTKKRQDEYVGERNVDIYTMRVYGKHNKKGSNIVTRFVDYMKYLNYSFEDEEVERQTVPVEAAQLRDATTDSDRQYYGDLLRAKGDRERRWDRNMLILSIIFNAFIITINIIGAFS